MSKSGVNILAILLVCSLGVLAVIGFIAGAGVLTTQGTLPEFDRLWNYGDPAGTETKFRQVLAQTEKTAPPGYIAELFTQIARCQGMQNDFDKANETLDRVEKMLVPGMDRARIRYLLERGRTLNSHGDPTKALPLFEQAWDLGQSSGESRLAFDALHMIAIVQPDPASQVEWNLKGIAAVEQTPSERGWLHAFYNNLGEAYVAQQQYQDALDAFRKLHELTISAGRPANIYTQKDIARMLRMLGKADEALATIRPVFEDLESTDKPNGWIDEEMAECLLATGHTAEARPLFKRAYEALRTDPWILKNDLAKLERLKTLAEK